MIIPESDAEQKTYKHMDVWALAGATGLIGGNLIQRWMYAHSKDKLQPRSLQSEPVLLRQHDKGTVWEGLPQQIRSTGDAFLVARSEPALTMNASKRHSDLQSAKADAKKISKPAPKVLGLTRLTAAAVSICCEAMPASSRT